MVDAREYVGIVEKLEWVFWVVCVSVLCRMDMVIDDRSQRGSLRLRRVWDQTDRVGHYVGNQTPKNVMFGCFVRRIRIA